MSLAALDTANLMIDEIVSHRVFARDASKVAKPPQLKDKLLFLPREGIDALQQRLTTSLGSKSHGVELSIESTGPGSFVQVGAHAIARLKTPDFIESSRAMATMLASAQASTSGLAGMVFVIRGRMGISPKRFAAVIKAEVHDGFGAGDDAPESDVTYLRNLALTPTQRLYKVGLLLELVPSLEQVPGTYSVSNYRAFLFDHLITATETKAAAAYFYSGFLGMDIQKSSKKLTQDFYEYTTAFIASSPLPEEDRWELREALRVELRSNSAIISVGDFACQYIDDEDLRDSFENFMESRDFPKNAVHKDVEYVKAKLRRPRRMSFTSGVKVIIPADAEREVVKVVEENDSQVTLVVRGSMTLE
ncbi:37-kD nucleoid-associated bacterial protein [compost metagenome]